MRTIQMTLDDDLVTAVDRVSKELRTSRSAFARKALRDAFARCTIEQLEQKHRGYERYPVAAYEFLVWETEQLGVMNETRRNTKEEVDHAFIGALTFNF